jgi:hypothetical protein
LSHHEDDDYAPGSFEELKRQALEKEKAPEEESIALNPEALKVQYQAQAMAVLHRAVAFIRSQGSSTTRVVDILEYKALKEEVAGFAMVSYELQLQETLARFIQQQPSGDPSPDSAAPPEGTVPASDLEIQPSSQS